MIILDSGLNEDLKWGRPCYTFENSTIVLKQGFKEYGALLFFKGILLNNANGILIKIGEILGQGARFGSKIFGGIAKMETILKAYNYEAIEIEKEGLKVNL